VHHGYKKIKKVSYLHPKYSKILSISNQIKVKKEKNNKKKDISGIEKNINNSEPFYIYFSISLITSH
jgi:hypothetical protein